MTDARVIPFPAIQVHDHYCEGGEFGDRCYMRLDDCTCGDEAAWHCPDHTMPTDND